MQASALKIQKTSGVLCDLYVDDWEKRGRIRMDTLHSISHHFQRLDWGPDGLKKQNKRNEPGFCLSTRS